MIPQIERKSFLQRRNAKIVVPWRALIEYGKVELLIAWHPSAMYDYYCLYSSDGRGNLFGKDLAIPKIPDKYNVGYFDIFGEPIENEKNRRSNKSH